MENNNLPNIPFKVGITCDNYKLKKFEETLKAEGFTDYKVVDFDNAKTLSLILVQTTADKTPILKNLCERVELHFKAQKN